MGTATTEKATKLFARLVFERRGSGVKVEFSDDARPAYWRVGQRTYPLTGLEAEPSVKHLVEDVLPSVPDSEWKIEDPISWVFGSFTAAKGLLPPIRQRSAVTALAPS